MIRASWSSIMPVFTVNVVYASDGKTSVVRNGAFTTDWGQLCMTERAMTSLLTAYISICNRGDIMSLQCNRPRETNTRQALAYKTFFS